MPYTAAQLTTYFTAADDGVAPSLAELVLLNSYALQDAQGTLSDAATLYNTIQAPPIQATVDVAEATYQFFTGMGVSAAGLNYLVLPVAQGGTNATNLNSAYYTSFNQENRYINFALALALTPGANATNFANTYGSLTLNQVIASAYQQIIGVSTVGAAAAAAGIAYLESATNEAYYAAVAAQRGPGGSTSLALTIDAVAVAEVLNAAVQADVGIYAQSLTAYTADLANGSVSPNAQNLLTYYGPGGPGNLTGVGNVIVSLTPGADIVNGATTVNADISPATLNGTGPTLNYNDNIQNVTNLNITDQYGQANDIIPATAVLANIKFVNLITAGNAGVGVNGGGSGSGTGTAFDVSGITGVQMVTVTSGGAATDTVKASPTTAITVTHNNFAGAVATLGGSNIVINDNATGGADTVGSFVFPGANPTGTVNVNEFGSNSLVVSGGSAAAGSTAVNVTRYGAGAITIGDAVISLVTPGTNVSSGNIVVTDNDTIQAAVGAISIFGGQNVTVNATPITGGNITVGTLAVTGAAPVSVNPTTGQQFVATGAVLVNDNVINAFQTVYRTGASFGTNANVTVVGGTTVGVTTNTGSVLVGAPAIVANGGATNLFNGTVAVLAPNGTSPLVSGAVTITDSAVSSAKIANAGTGAVINAGDANSAAAYNTFLAANPGNFGGANALAAGVAVGETAINVYGGVGSATTNAVTINALASAVTVGADTLNGVPTNVAAPNGAVVVNDGVNLTGITPINGAYDNVLNLNQRNVVVEGGQVTNVTINTNQGTVLVGSVDTPATDAAQPTGVLTVVDSAGYVLTGLDTTIDGTGNAALDAVTVFGGSGATGSVTVTASGGTVVVGTAAALPFTNTAGAITVTQAAIETGASFAASTVTVFGGTVDTIKTTGGSVLVGSALAPAAGAVSITDTFNLPTGVTGFGAMAAVDGDTFNVIGGSTVAITTAPSSGAVNVGAVAPVLNAAGTGLANANQYASGNVAISDYSGTAAAKNLVYGTGADTVNTLGATQVSIIGAGATTITDENSTLATQGAGAGAPIAATTLATIILDKTGNTTINDNPTALTLSLFDGAGAGTINDANAHTVALTVGASAGTLTDNTATSITVGDSATGGVGATAAGSLTFNGSKLTSATFTNAAAQTFTLAGDALLASIIANNTGALTLGNLTGNAVLKTITAGSSSTGAITVAINPQATSFLGGGSTGNDTVTITANNATLGASVGAVTAGGGTNNIVILDYNNAGSPALGQITGFQSAQVGSGTLASNPVTAGVYTGVYNLTGYKGVIAGGVLNGAVSFNTLSAGTTLAITGNTVAFASGAQNLISYQLQADTASDTLALTLGSGTAAVGVIANTTTTSAPQTNTPILLNTTQPYVAPGGGTPVGTVAMAGGIENMNITAAGPVSTTFAGFGNMIQITDPATQALTIGGTGATTITSGFGGDTLKTIVVSDTSAVNVAGITSYAGTGVAISDTSAAGRITAATSVMHQQDTVTISGNYAIGDVVNEVIGVTPYAYTVLAADIGGSTAATDQNIAAKLATAINTSVTNGSANPNVAGATATGGVVTINYTTAGLTSDVTHGVETITTKSVGQAAAGVYNTTALSQTDTINITIPNNGNKSVAADTISVTLGGTTYTTGALGANNAQTDAGTVAALITGLVINGETLTATNVSTSANNGIVKLVFSIAGGTNTAIVDSSTYNNTGAATGSAALAHQNYQVDTVTTAGNWLTGNVASETITAGVGPLGLPPTTGAAPNTNAAATYNGTTGAATSANAATVLDAAVTAGNAPGLTVTATGVAGLTASQFNVISTAGQTFTDTVSASSVSNAESLAFVNSSTAAKTAVAQVNQITITAGADLKGDVFYDTVNSVNYFYTVTANGETSNAIATGLKTATTPAGITVTSAANVITLTANVAGTPFTETSGVLAVGGGTGESATTTNPTPNVTASGQTDTLTVNGAWTAGDVVSVEANGQVYNVTLSAGQAATTTTVATAVAGALNGFNGLTAVAAGNVVTITDPVGSGALTDTATYGTPAGDSVVGTILTSPVDSFTTGAGGGVLTIGGGGGWSPYLQVSAAPAFGGYSAGSETINLTASAGASDTLVAKDGVVSTANNIAGGITGFAAVNTLNADKIIFATAAGALGIAVVSPLLGNFAKQVVGNTTATVTVSTLTNALNMANVLDTSGATAVDFSNITYTTSNGVITFALVGAHFLGNIGNDYLYAAEAIVNQSPNQIAEFVYNGTTYVVASGAASGGPNTALFNENISAVSGTNFNATTVLQFSGMTGVTGFDSANNVGPIPSVTTGIMSGFGASNSILANVLNVNAASVAAPGGNGTWVSGTAGSAAVVYSDTGFSLDNWTNANGASATGTTSFNNLAPASILNVATTGAQGTLAVTQAGTAGADTLSLVFQGGAMTVNAVTTSNDWSLSLQPFTNTTINTFTDTTGAETTWAISGVANLAIGQVNATALTSILAGGTVTGYNADTGALSLGVAATPLTQTGLTITGALGGDVIWTSGTGDNISVGNWANNTTGFAANAVTGNVNIFASGATDTISLVNMGVGSVNLISANGTKDVISVEAGSNTIGSTVLAAGLNPTTQLTGALSSSDTVKLLDSGTLKASGVIDNVWLGSNSLVTIGGNTSVANLGGASADTAFGTQNATSLANVVVTNDNVGGLSSSVVAGTATVAGTGLTTISAAFASTVAGHLNIYFDSANNTSVVGTEAESWANGGGNGLGDFVNVQSATSLANALDIAAAQAVVLAAQVGPGGTTTVSNGVLLENGNTGLIDWFQYGGNTYLVEANNHSTTAGATGALAHTGLQTGDVVVELVGLVNLNGSTVVAGLGAGAGLGIHIQ